MKNPSKRHGNSTLAIHVGEDKFGVSGPVGVPIARTSGFTFATVDEMKRWAEGKSSVYIYTRYGNPTLAIAEAKLAALERGEAAVVTSSGSSAISSALLSQLQAGDEVISSAQIYGGSYRLLRDIFPRFGIRVLCSDCSRRRHDACHDGFPSSWRRYRARVRRKSTEERVACAPSGERLLVQNFES